MRRRGRGGGSWKIGEAGGGVERGGLIFCEGIYLIMGEEAEAAVDASSSRSVTVHVRCSNGNKFSLPVDLTSTVRDLKVLLVERSEIPADQQRLIYKGRVLKDDSTLESYGVLSCRYLLRL